MGMNQESSLGASFIGELSLHKNGFSKQTHGEIIMPPYSIKTLVSSLFCKEQGILLLQYFMQSMQPQVDCIVLPLECKRNQDGRKKTLVWPLKCKHR